jgi:hypothetical protein
MSPSAYPPADWERLLDKALQSLLSDNRRLSPKRRQRQYTKTTDYAEFAHRVLVSYGDRCAEEDPDGIHGVVKQLRADLEVALSKGVAAWRVAGLTDGEIGQKFDPPISKQAVRKRFPRQLGSPD